MDEEKEEEIELTYNQEHKEEQKESEEEWNIKNTKYCVINAIN